jgi:hypothetical protein
MLLLAIGSVRPFKDGACQAVTQVAMKLTLLSLAALPRNKSHRRRGVKKAANCDCRDNASSPDYESRPWILLSRNEGTR